MEKGAVYKAIAKVTLALSKEGISKDRKNTSQNYAFRGIDDIYNALASQLAENQLCILPEVQERTCEERQTKGGSTLFYVNLKVAFDFVSAEDGSSHRIVTFGEAMDSGDKATNKAMSAAYKYAALMAFCIPTEGDNDTDNQTHEVVATVNPSSLSLTDRATKLGTAIAGSKTGPDLDKVVAQGNGLLAELKTANAPMYDGLMKNISDRQTTLLATGVSP